jgi:YidC/Oxa1 family membrane protein insertase
MGLTGWELGGIFVRPFEWIQVSTGLPWFYTIIIGTLFWRLTVVYFSVCDYRDAAILRNSSLLIKDIAATHTAMMSGDLLLAVAAFLRAEKAEKDAGLSLNIMATRQLIQLPLSIELFFAVKKMCELPVEHLKHSGVSFLPDLTLISGYLLHVIHTNSCRCLTQCPNQGI